MRLTTILAAALVALAACSPGNSQGTAAAPASVQPSRHPVSGLAVVPLTITHVGARHVFRVEVAASDLEQEMGLMLRQDMGADEGMIFPMDPPRSAIFWMKNTILPLDIVFIGPDRRVRNIAVRAVPYSLTPIPSAGPVSAVLELNGGKAKELGIAPGDTVDW